MRYLKISIIVLLVAVITNVGLVMAGNVVTQTTYQIELDKNNSYYTSYNYKETYTYMKYSHIESYTWLTNPCENCEVAVRVNVQNGASGSAHITKMGYTYTLKDNTAWQAPETYRLRITRHDSTLLTTHHNSIWYINI